jgi:hypothetical protein
VHGSDYSGIICDTADGSIGVTVRASGINLLYAIQPEVTIGRVIHPICYNWCQKWFTNLNTPRSRKNIELYEKKGMKMEEQDIQLILETLKEIRNGQEKADADRKAWQEKIDADTRATRAETEEIKARTRAI